jgi:CBS domain containing-hemolysin-like protein
LLILATGFYVAGEFALLAVDRNRIEQLAKRNHRGANSVLTALRSLSFQLSGAQLGITVTSLLVGFVVEGTVGRALRPLVAAILPGSSSLQVSLVLALVLVTALQMILSELVPKNLAIARPLGLATAISTPFRLANAAFRPLIVFLNASANWTVRRFGIEPREELAGVLSMDELKRLITSSRREGILPEEEFALLTRSINFGNKTADDALVPRVAIVAVRSDDTLTMLARVALETGHSRFPVCGDGGIDDIAGVVLVKDSYRFSAQERGTRRVAEVMTEALFVPESRPLDSLLAEMRRQRKHLAVVADEYGGTAGIVTLEDLLEEIVGEIDDEYDPHDSAPRLTSPTRGIHVISGMLHPDEVAEATGFETPASEHYETLAGFLLFLFNRIPQQGDHISYQGWELKVVEMEGRRISQVLIVAPPPVEEEEE